MTDKAVKASPAVAENGSSGEIGLVVTEPTRNGGRTPKGHKPYTIQVVGRILEIRQLVIVLRDLAMIEEAMAQHSG